MTRRVTLPEPWRSMAVEAGGVGELAKLFRVSPKTLYNWAHGKSGMSGPAQIQLERLKKKFAVKNLKKISDPQL